MSWKYWQGLGAVMIGVCMAIYGNPPSCWAVNCHYGQWVLLAPLQKKKSAPASLNKTKCWDGFGENHDQKCDKNNRKEPIEDRVDQWWEPIRRCYLRAAAHRGLGCTPYTVVESWGQDPMEQV